jgi:hypothetical protein
MLEAMRKLSVELPHRGVTTAIVEGAYPMWWLRVSSVIRSFAEGGFERSLGRIGPNPRKFRRGSGGEVSLDEVEDQPTVRHWRRPSILRAMRYRAVLRGWALRPKVSDGRAVDKCTKYTAARRRGQQGDRQWSITPRERTDKLTVWGGGAARLPHDGIQALPVRASSAPRCAQHGEFLRSNS